jgi:hypothetical protein
MTKPDDTVDLPPSREQLQMAYRHLAQPGWPSTLDAALASKPHCIAITQVARRLNRPTWQQGNSHSLPRLPAPPTPTMEPGAGSRADGRSHLSKAKGPKTALGSFARPTPLGMLSNPHRFDAKKAAAHDLDD